MCYDILSILSFPSSGLYSLLGILGRRCFLQIFNLILVIRVWCFRLANIASPL